FISAAHGRGIAVIGSPADSKAVARASQLKLDAVMFEGSFDSALAIEARAQSLMGIELSKRRGVRFDSRDAILGTSQSLWPGIEIEHGGKTVGPTSSPWIHTNGGFLRFVRGATEAAVWIGVRPPPGTIFPMVRYAQAIGDAAIVGARWIVS